MFSPYRIIEEDETTITYEYSSAYTWALYGILVVLFVGMTMENQAIELLGAILILAYFSAKFLLGKAAYAHIKSAVTTQTAQLSGLKHSFSNPLRIRVPKNA